MRQAAATCREGTLERRSLSLPPAGTNVCRRNRNHNGQKQSDASSARPRHKPACAGGRSRGVLSSWCRIDPRGPPRPSAPDLEACSSPEALRAWTPFWHLPGRPNSAPGFWLPRPSAVAPRAPSAWGPPTAQLPDPRVGTTALKAGCGSLALLGSLALPPPHSRGLGPSSRARCYLGRGEGRRGNHAWAGGAGPTWLAGKAQSGEMPPAK